MTREEAIEILSVYQEGLNNWGMDRIAKAFDMAIEALSEPNMIPIKLEKKYPESRDEDITDAFMQGYLKGKADRPQGEWIKYESPMDYDDGKDAWDCSLCGAMVGKRMNFCPNCGADMRGDAE